MFVFGNVLRKASYARDPRLQRIAWNTPTQHSSKSDLFMNFSSLIINVHCHEIYSKRRKLDKTNCNFKTFCSALSLKLSLAYEKFTDTSRTYKYTNLRVRVINSFYQSCVT